METRSYIVKIDTDEYPVRLEGKSQSHVNRRFNDFKKRLFLADISAEFLIQTG